MRKRLSDEEIAKTYEMLRSYHEKHLKAFGVTLPRLVGAGGKYTKDALVLVYLAQGYPDTKTVSKTELTQFVRVFYPEVNDVQ